MATAALLALRRLGLAAQLLARALRHVLPLLGQVVLLRLAGAGMGGGAAIVLARLGDAVALLALALVLGLCGLGDPQREDAGDGGVDEVALAGHASLLESVPRPARGAKS